MRARRHRGGRSFFWRVYLHGLVVLVLVAVAVAVAGASAGKTAWKDFPERLGRWLGETWGAELHDPAKLSEQVARTAELLQLDVAVYAPDGTPLATAGAPMAALSPAERERALRAAFRLEWGRHAAPLVREGVVVGYAVANQRDAGPALHRGLFMVIAALLTLALASVPLARQITRPLTRLTAAAKRLGEGDLSVRTNLCRGDELGALSRAFDEMAARIEHMVRAERELLAGVSHELRTPLARIRVALELAEEGDAAGAQRRLGQIAEDLQELERLVDDVLSAARLDRADGAPPLRRERVEAVEIARQAAERFERSHEGRALRVELEEGASLDADPALLRRALDNLLDNARKYSDGPILLRLTLGPSDVRYAVQDQGIGVTPEELPRLGTPFFRTDQSRARGTGGVGLGLHLCRKIVQAHGGALVLESAPGAGTTASITVPRLR